VALADGSPTSKRAPVLSGERELRASEQGEGGASVVGKGVGGRGGGAVAGRGEVAVGTREVWESGMVHLRLRWPDCPQLRQRTGSRQTRTLCLSERHLKQPRRLRVLKGAGGVRREWAGGGAGNL
jgi:hypothetical protein